MIINRRQTEKSMVILTPTNKQNKYLRSIGPVKVYGENFNGYGYADTVRGDEVRDYARREAA